jgi:poly(hydroxyalkanoate) granule-associated protein
VTRQNIVIRRLVAIKTKSRIIQLAVAISCLSLPVKKDSSLVPCAFLTPPEVNDIFIYNALRYFLNWHIWRLHMADVEVVIEETTEEKEPNPFFNMVHRVLLAGIGAVALTQEEMEKFVNRLVERGEIAEHDGRKMLKDVMERRRRKAEEAEEEVKEVVAATGSEIDSRIESILHRMNVPTKSDINALSEKISLLADKVDQLNGAEVEETA